MREIFLVGFVFLFIATAQCISYMNVGWNTMHIICSMVYGGMEESEKLANKWSDELNASFNEVWMSSCIKILENLSIQPQDNNLSIQPQDNKFCFITTDSMNDFFDFYYIYRLGFRFVKESIFDTIEFLITDRFLEEISRKTKEHSSKKNITAEKFADTLMNEIKTLVIRKLKPFWQMKFPKVYKTNKSKKNSFEIFLQSLNVETDILISKFNRINFNELFKKCQSNKNVAMVSKALLGLKSKHFLFIYSKLLISKFYIFLYKEFQEDIYFDLFGKKKDDCIAIEKEKNMVYKRLENMRSKIGYDGDLNNIFVPFSNGDKSSRLFEHFCELSVDIHIISKFKYQEPRFFVTTVLTEKFQLFRPLFIDSTPLENFYLGIWSKIRCEMINYGGLLGNSYVFHFSFVDSNHFFLEFLINYAYQLINSPDKPCLSEIIKQEHECISDDTKKLILAIHLENSIQCLFSEILTAYKGFEKFKGKLIISILESSFDSFQEIYNNFLKGIKIKKEIFLVSQDEMEICRNFFLRCILFKFESMSNDSKLSNILSFEVEKIKK